MNFGAFAGGFSNGLDNGMRISKNIRDLIKEAKLQDLREQGMAEAEAARARSVNDMIREQGVQTSETPTSGAVSTEQTQVADSPAPGDVKTLRPVRPGVVETRELPPLGPKPPAVGAGSDGNVGEAEARDAMASKIAPSQPPATPQETPVQATQQQATASTGLKGNIPGQSGFWVNGQRYDTREQARAAADKAAPSTMDFFIKNAVPKISEQYMVNGDPSTAKAWTDYAESQNGKRAIKDWAAAYSAPDFDTAVERFGRYYTDHINDGVDYSGHKMKVNADGTQVAVVTLKDKATGKETEMELTREKMLALGGANNPQKLFETEVARQREAEKLKYEAKLKAQERREKNQDALSLEGYKAGLDAKKEGLKQDRLDERERLKSKLGVERMTAKEQAKYDTNMELLKGMGYTSEQIAKFGPGMVGADGGVGKAPHPDAIRMQVYNKLASDGNITKYDTVGPDGKPAKKYFKDLSNAERKAIVDQESASVSSILGGDAGAPSAASATQSGGAMPPVSPGLKEGSIARNRDTGQTFVFRGGKWEASAAAPAPAAAAPATSGPNGGVSPRQTTGSW